MTEQETKDLQEKALLVGLDLGKKGGIKIESSMDELAELVKAAGGEVVSQVVQNRDRIHPAFFIGKGKAEEIATYCDTLEVDIVVFNDELSGTQIRNLEDIIGTRVVDRTSLILDIFAKRAVSKEGKLQVELAQLKYRLPRLKGLGTSLSRTGAGIGARGPGEKKLELDRRHILANITEIKKQLEDLANVRETKRKQRLNANLPIVALVGYTNAGKSTLMNTLLSRFESNNEEREVFAYDMLFATLDTTLRKTRLLNGHEVLVTDTVGFVSKLPTHLVEAFKGTLEEVKYADLLLHVVDVTNEDLDIQIQTTLDVLTSLGVSNKPIITVFNKVDQGKGENVDYDLPGPKVFISAKEGYNIDALLKLIEQESPKKFYEVTILIPYEEGQLASYFFNQTKVLGFEYVEKGTKIVTTLNEKDYNKYQKYVME